MHSNAIFSEASYQAGMECGQENGGLNGKGGWMGVGLEVIEDN